MKGVGLKNKAGTTQQQEEEIVPLKSKQINLVGTKQVIRLQSPAYQAKKENMTLTCQRELKCVCVCQYIFS